VECRFLGFFFSSEGSQEAAMIGSLSEDKAGQVDQQKRDFLANLATHPARDFGAYLFLTSGEAITTKHNSLSHITTIENYDIKRKMSWAEVRMFSQHGQDYVFRDDTDNILLLARGLILSVEKAMEFSIQNKLPLNSKFVKAIIDGTTDCLVHLAKYAELMDKELRLPEDPAETQEKQ
jgi:tricorn protease-like protein